MFCSRLSYYRKLYFNDSGDYIYTMDKTSQGRTKIQYAVSLMIILYFILAFYPKYFGNGQEFIPFSLFNLYSMVPGDYNKMDLLIKDECGKEYFLLYKNENLNRIERKYFLRKLNDIRNIYNSTQHIDLDSDNEIVRNIEGEIYLVKMTGDYIETLIEEKFDSEIITRIK